jgi:hypothetical protein
MRFASTIPERAGSPAVPRGRRKQRGNSLVEFALISVFIVPLMLGTVSVGMALGRSIQATQVSRDAGHMFVRQLDFSIPANQDIVVRLAYGMGMTRTGGNGVVILSRIMFIGTAECAAGGLTVGQCPNYNLPVFTQRIVIGNPSKRTSSFGTPASNLLLSNGEITPANYLTQASARVQNFGTLLTLQPAELAYVAEAYFEAPEWSFPGTAYTGTGVYARTIF